MRRFYLFRRNSKNKIYYAQIVNPLTGKRMPSRSTGCTDKDEAHFTVMSWLKNNEISESYTKEKRNIDEVYALDDLLYKLKTTHLYGSDIDKIIEVLKSRGLISSANSSVGEQQTLISSLLEFWDWDKSAYVAEKKAYKQSIGKAHVDSSRKCIINYWQHFFETDLRLADLTREHLREFSMYLSQQKIRSRDTEKRELDDFLSSRTKNAIIKAGSVALNWAHKNGRIDMNPAAGIMKFGVKAQKRCILSDLELSKLFSSGNWAGNEGARLACMLASQTKSADPRLL